MTTEEQGRLPRRSFLAAATAVSLAAASGLVLAGAPNALAADPAKQQDVLLHLTTEVDAKGKSLFETRTT